MSNPKIEKLSPEAKATPCLPAPLALTPDQIKLVAAGIVGGAVTTPNLDRTIICGGIPVDGQIYALLPAV